VRVIVRLETAALSAGKYDSPLEKMFFNYTSSSGLMTMEEFEKVGTAWGFALQPLALHITHSWLCT
jgi:hypothetical protein